MHAFMWRKNLVSSTSTFGRILQLGDLFLKLIVRLMLVLHDVLVLLELLNVSVRSLLLGLELFLRLVQCLGLVLAVLMQLVDFLGERLKLAVEIVVLNLNCLDPRLVIFGLLLELDDIVSANLQLGNVRLALVDASGLDLADILFIQALHLVLEGLKLLTHFRKLRVLRIKLVLDALQLAGKFVTIRLDAFQLSGIILVGLNKLLVLFGELGHFSVGCLELLNKLGR